MEDIENICRICLKAETQNEFTRIFSQNNEIALKINLISGIKVIEFQHCAGRALICSSCLKELYQCILFRKKCQSSDEYFKTKTLKLESTLWHTQPLIDDDLSEIKIESLDEKLNSSETDFDCYDLQTEDLLVNQFSTNDEVEEMLIKEEKKPLRPVAIQKKEKTSKTKNNSLRCQYCGITLSRRNRLIQHERLHLIDETQQFYECFICGKTFNQKFGLIPHFRRFHFFSPGSKERWKCAICPNKILPPGNLALHYEKEHAHFTSKSRISLKETAARKIKPKVLKDPELKKPRYRRKEPKLPKPTPNFWPCSICGNSFSNYVRYKKHLKEIHEVNEQHVLQDTAALKNSIPDTGLMLAEKPEEKGPKFPCKTCGKVYASVMTVRAHEKTHLNIEYLCDLCGSSFRVKAYLTAHVQKVHMKLKKFKCSIENCSAAFVHRELLNYHVRKHLNIRNFACRYCGKTFTTKNCCTIHERIHTDERPYSCGFCERTFIHHSDHRRHELKHTITTATVSITVDKHHDQFTIIHP